MAGPGAAWPEKVAIKAIKLYVRGSAEHAGELAATVQVRTSADNVHWKDVPQHHVQPPPGRGRGPGGTAPGAGESSTVVRATEKMAKCASEGEMCKCTAGRVKFGLGSAWTPEKPVLADNVAWCGKEVRGAARTVVGRLHRIS
jgi:hypothetical protein